MITTSTSISVTKVLRKGVVTAYSVGSVSLFVKFNGSTKRYNASALVNSSASADGLITFTAIPLAEDGSYSVWITADNNADLDTNGVSLDKLATGYIKKITNVSTLEL